MYALPQLHDFKHEDKIHYISSAYKDVASCSVDVTLGTCDIAIQSFVDSLLDVTSRASRSAMGCTGDLLGQF
ncbi:hypothetical protein DPMN_130063 [Dreissena polymorpha]|uniref:Uncharacterized protein n=1 Tax=Dreissena polymorpha TaxID=45954 RepID=A0A9D4K129_DREPO|nr:hypothetical protein DPMN_130063 [Dreissena polymorpha]